MERQGDGAPPERERGQSHSCNFNHAQDDRYDRMEAQQSRCNISNIPPAALQQKEEEEQRPQI